MKRDLVNLLACPICKAPLDLQVDAEEEDEIVSGALVCTKGGEIYPIENYIPNLLPSDFYTD